MKVYDSTLERVVDSQHYQALDKLEELKNKNDLWGVVGMCLEIWSRKNPQKYDSYLLDVKEERRTRGNKFASSRSKSLRYTMSMPSEVVYMLRKVYTVEELPMDKKFFEQCWRRYPQLRVAERY